jgi:hypothetical protein
MMPYATSVSPAEVASVYAAPAVVGLVPVRAGPHSAEEA